MILMSKYRVILGRFSEVRIEIKCNIIDYKSPLRRWRSAIDEDDVIHGGGGHVLFSSSASVSNVSSASTSGEISSSAAYATAIASSAGEVHLIRGRRFPHEARQVWQAMELNLLNLETQSPPPPPPRGTYAARASDGIDDKYAKIERRKSSVAKEIKTVLASVLDRSLGGGNVDLAAAPKPPLPVKPAIHYRQKPRAIAVLPSAGSQVRGWRGLGPRSRSASNSQCSLPELPKLGDADVPSSPGHEAAAADGRDWSGMVGGRLVLSVMRGNGLLLRLPSTLKWQNLILRTSFSEVEVQGIAYLLGSSPHLEKFIIHRTNIFGFELMFLLEEAIVLEKMTVNAEVPKVDPEIPIEAISSWILLE
ncbi:hypothetical protein NL676_003197 [Syzygium grande]|nr:hypothetical protein NL676_003197 [Syzygium grande]